MNVKYMCAQPAITYYAWQVEVMIHSFIKNGVNPNNIEIVCSYTDEVPELWRRLATHYNTVRFFFYKDTRFNSNYVSSIRPHILDKHWKAYPELQNDVILYHDCDIALVKPLDLSTLLSDDICYVSDTVGYINIDYIRSKGEQYVDLMTGIVGINKITLEHYNKDSGGAQYLLKNIPQGFWEKVYWDSENLFRQVNLLIEKEKPGHPIQIWCADMWAVLWNLWLYGKLVKVVPELCFTVATSFRSELSNCSIYHNAGVVERNGIQFYKPEFINKLPYDINAEEYDPNFCSRDYVELIKEVSTKTILN